MRQEHIHLIGVCGTGMASLAGLFSAAGFKISGSDSQCYPPMSTMLESLGVQIQLGFKPENLQPRPDLVIIGNVCTPQNPEARAAIDSQMRYLSMSDAVAEYFCAGRLPIVITGTHGKTSTASLAAHLLYHAKQDPSFLIGGIPHEFGQSFRLGQGPHIVIEGDEYDTAFFDKTPKFLHYRAKAVHLGPVEFDHADIYNNLDEVLAAFRALITSLPKEGLLVACVDSDNVRALLSAAKCRVITYSVTGQEADVTGTLTDESPDGTSFTLASKQETVAFQSPMTGMHNMQNATGIITLLKALGLSDDSLTSGLRTFKGAKRRQEVVGTHHDITVIDDFAHHPTAIRETIKALRAKYPDHRLTVLFEPRSNTSGRALFYDQYLEAFSGADRVWLGPVHKVDRIPADQILDTHHLAQALTEKGIPTTACQSNEDILSQVAPLLEGPEIVALMSNGSFDGLHQRLLATIK